MADPSTPVVETALPYDDSRRLTGPNLYFASTGAVLTPLVAVDDALEQRWVELVRAAQRALHWGEPPVIARRHPGGAELALAAPVDQLFTATEVNEWAFCAALVALGRVSSRALDRALQQAAEANPSPPAVASGVPPVVDPQHGLARLERMALYERSHLLRALLDAARERGLPWLLDDDELTLGLGAGGRSHALDALPTPQALPWDELHGVPLAVVTGSNGKTTTVRVIAAALDAAGLSSGHCCTDGVFVAGEALGSGDYSGPQGARRVLRDRRTQSAVLETARGGILRRGLAVARADAAVVTNVSADHFGEYGIHDLGALADAKLAVAHLIDAQGLLVLNADDAELRARGAARAAAGMRVGWFAADLHDATAAGGRSACGGYYGHLVLEHDDLRHDLGAIADLPLTAGGSAAYNLANLAAAALAAAALGVPATTIAAVVQRFGRNPDDNPGRLMRFALGDVTALVDYAHNPEGLAGLLAVAEGMRGAGAARGRLALLLGHAGNRLGADFEGVGAAAAAARPDLVVVKENEGHIRGRASGEVTGLLRAALLSAGQAEASVEMAAGELEAVRRALGWARSGDVLVLPVHALAARAATVALLEKLKTDGWRAGQPLP